MDHLLKLRRLSRCAAPACACPARRARGRIAAAIQRLLAEPGFRTAAGTLGAAVRADIEAGGLVREIGAMVGAHRDAVSCDGGRLWA